MHATARESIVRRLDPFGDVTVSKGFARREHAGTVDAMPFVAGLMSRAARPAYARFCQGRRLEPAGLAAMGSVADARGAHLAATLLALRRFDPAASDGHEAGCAAAADWVAGFVDDPRNAAILRRTAWPPEPVARAPYLKRHLLRKIIGPELLGKGDWRLPSC